MQGYGLRSISVFIVDDHDIVRRGLRDLMAVRRDITVLGDSGSAGRSIERILDLKPDVMVLDLQLQDGSGIHVCRAVRSVEPSIHGLLVTSANEDEALRSAILAGASGYATKLVHSSGILDDIRRIGAGHDLLDTVAARTARSLLLDQAESGSLGLTERQLTLFRHVLDGHTNGEVADAVATARDKVDSEIADLIDSVTARLGAG